MQLLEALEQVLAHLEAEGHGTALLGGLAVSAWTEPRFTRDVDLAVAVHADAEAESLVRRLTEHGYRLWSTVEQKAVKRLATARLLPPGGTTEGMVVDLLFASSGIEPEIVDAAADLDIGGARSVRIARIGHLVALKLLSNDPTSRPQDGADLQSLKSVLDATEIQRARDACRLIGQRGFNRGRDLPRLLHQYLGE